MTAGFAVIRIYQNKAKEGAVVAQCEAHGQPRLTDAHGERQIYISGINLYHELNWVKGV